MVSLPDNSRFCRLVVRIKVILIFLISLIIVIAVVCGVRAGTKKANEEKRERQQVADRQRAQAEKDRYYGYNPIQSGIDSTNMPPGLSEEEKAIIRKIAAASGHRFVSLSDIDNYSIASMDRLFQSMASWQQWDDSIHRQSGQLERMRRAPGVSVEWYDPKSKRARVRGSSGQYLTSSSRCSCPDFRDRNIPCKHMYALAMELDGDEERIIPSSDPPLYMLEFALAGRFGRKDDPSGIRHFVNSLGGIFSDILSKNTALLITGEAASENKKLMAQRENIEVLSEEQFRSIFR